MTFLTILGVTEIQGSDTDKSIFFTIVSESHGKSRMMREINEHN